MEKFECHLTRTRIEDRAAKNSWWLFIIDAEVQAGKEKAITVKPTNPGTNNLVCRYRLQEGMGGNVMVNE